MLHPDDYADVLDSVNDQIRSSSKHMDHVIYRIIRKDGSIRWVDDYGHYTQTDNYGGIYYVFIADVTQNGKEALEMFSSSDDGYYDAVLMDIRMPQMDGLEATENIRRMGRSDARRIPVIAMTANEFDEDVQRSLRAGMNAHLTKPVEPEKLCQTLEELIWESEKEL